MIERNLSLHGTIILAAVLGGAAVGCVLNPAPFQAAFEVVFGWVGSRRAAALLCFVPVLLAGAAAGYGDDFLTGRGVFGPKPAEGVEAE